MPTRFNHVIYWSFLSSTCFGRMRPSSGAPHLLQLLQKCSDVCHRGHGGASVCVSSIKVHIWIHCTCNQGVRKWFKSNYGSVLVSVRWLLATL